MKRKKNKVPKKSKSIKLVEKAGLAIKNEFYLEATWILTAMFEGKIGRVLDKLEPASLRQGLTFAQLVKRLKYLHVSGKYPELMNGFDIALIDEIRNWKNQRNEILKDLPDIHVSPARMERLATGGVKLYKEFNKRVKAFKTGDGPSEEKS